LCKAVGRAAVAGLRARLVTLAVVVLVGLAAQPGGF
jgi:hypothetical protein